MSYSILKLPGYYIYTEGSDTSDGDIARARSPIQKIDEESCLTFYTHMYGDSIVYLKIYKYNYKGGTQQIDTINWSQNDTWFSSSYNMPKGEYGIAFEAKKGFYARADFAIDDVDIRPGRCSSSGKHILSFSDIFMQLQFFACCLHFAFVQEHFHV